MQYLISSAIHLRFIVGVLLCQALVVPGRAQSKSSKPPVATRVPHETLLLGERLQDPYFWIREKTNPAVTRYLKSENRYTEAVMGPTKALQRKLWREMKSHIKETDLSVPFRFGGWWYYSRTETGKQYPIHCRKRGTLESTEEVVLDLNRLARGQKFLSLGGFGVSDNGNRLAYSIDHTGFREYVLQVKDLSSGQVLDTRIEHVSDFEWATDNDTLFYTVEDAAKRPYRLYRHRLSQPQADELIYEEKDERFDIAIGRSRSRAWLFLEVSSHTTSEVHILRADDPAGSFRIVAPREQDHEYELDHHGGWFYIRSNQSGRNFALFRAPVINPARSEWQSVLEHRPDVMLEGADFFEKFYVLSELQNARPHLRIFDATTGASHELDFPEPTYSASLHMNPEFDSATFRYSYESLTTPPTIYEYDPKARRSTLLKQIEIPGGFRSANYQTERIEAVATDGKKIPISLVYRAGMRPDGKAPLLLTAYGAYGIPSLPRFSSSRLSLLDRGVVYALAHVRGGGDLGKGWHDEGRMLKKRNTFTDFVACAEQLVAEGYCRRDGLAIQGGSAGGLLIGAVLNLRPDLFHAAILDVPFVDVINTMLDETLPLTVGEFEEWGNPKKSEDYAYIKSYCPYSNLRRGTYPAMLINTSLNDSQVMYWEPTKYIAKLRTLKTDDHPLLLRVNMNAGHGGASGRYDNLKEVAFDYAFLLHQWGIRD